MNIKSQLVDTPSNGKEYVHSSATNAPEAGADFQQALIAATVTSSRYNAKSSDVVYSGTESKDSVRSSRGVQESVSRLPVSGKGLAAAVTARPAAKLSKVDNKAASSAGANAISDSNIPADPTGAAATMTANVSLLASSNSCFTPGAQPAASIDSVTSLDGMAGTSGQSDVAGENNLTMGSGVTGQSAASSSLADESNAHATAVTPMDLEVGSCDSAQSAGTVIAPGAESTVTDGVPGKGLLQALVSPNATLDGRMASTAGAQGSVAATGAKADNEAASALSKLQGRDALKTNNEATAAIPSSGSQTKEETKPVAATSSAHALTPIEQRNTDHAAVSDLHTAPESSAVSSASTSATGDAVQTGLTQLQSVSASSLSSNQQISFAASASVPASGSASVPASVPGSSAGIKTDGLTGMTSSPKSKTSSELRSGSTGQAASSNGGPTSLLNSGSQAAGSDIQTNVDAIGSTANTLSSATLNQQNIMPVPPNVQAAPAEVSSPTQPSVHNSDGSSSSASPAQAPADNGSMAAQAMPSVNNAQLIQSMHHSEMRLGMHSTEFGNLSISTSLNHQALSAQISTDHAELGRALAMHLPAMQEKLGNAYGMQARVEIRDGGSSSSYSNAGQQSKENRQGQPQSLTGSTMTSLDTTSVSNGSTTASMYADASRLDIRV